MTPFNWIMVGVFGTITLFSGLALLVNLHSRRAFEEQAVYAPRRAEPLPCNNTLTSLIPDFYAEADRVHHLFPLVAGKAAEGSVLCTAEATFERGNSLSLDAALGRLAAAIEATRTPDGWLMEGRPPAPSAAVVDVLSLTLPHSGLTIGCTLTDSGITSLSAAWAWTARGAWKSAESFPQDGRTVILRQDGEMYFARQAPEGLKIRPFIAERDGSLAADGYWTDVQESRGGAHGK